SAQRRIDAMRAIKTMPELKQKIETGRITLSAVATAQSFFRQEAKQNRPVSVEKRVELFKSLEGKTKKEAEKTLCTEFPLTLPRDKERELTEDKTEIRFVASKDLMEKLARVKSLMSHKNPNPTYEELFSLMAEFVLT